MAHKTTAWFMFFALAAFPVFAGCDGEGESAVFQDPPVKIEDVEGIARDNLYLDGRVFIAGQPSESAFAELARRGVTVVVNTRTPAEVEDREQVAFDEKRIVEDLGMSYVWIPLGGDDHPYEPAAVEQLAEVLAANHGHVVIHCLYGGRAAYLWLAHLVRNEGVPLAGAMARGESMMLKPHPVGRLLDRPTKLVFVQ